MSWRICSGRCPRTRVKQVSLILRRRVSIRSNSFMLAASAVSNRASSARLLSILRRTMVSSVVSVRIFASCTRFSLDSKAPCIVSRAPRTLFWSYNSVARCSLMSSAAFCLSSVMLACSVFALSSSLSSVCDFNSQSDCRVLAAFRMIWTDCQKRRIDCFSTVCPPFFR